MFRGSVRAAGIAALIGACVASASLGHASDLRGWTPKKSQREMLHPNDCNFGYYGTAWRAWPEDCNRVNGCENQFAPAMPPPQWDYWESTRLQNFEITFCYNGAPCYLCSPFCKKGLNGD